MRTRSHVEAPLPWHETCWNTLRGAKESGHLPHALLVTGPPGVGKRRLVTLLSCSLLCAKPDGRGLACGHCRECELLFAGTHPDYIEIGPDLESKSSEIKVDTIRRLADSDALTAHRGGFKVIVLDSAQNMNLSAANSLLKTLEEPSPDTLLCLVCEQPGRLPATVRSRCQELRVPIPSEAQAIPWLQQHTSAADAATLLRLAHGAPLKALALENDGLLSLRARAFTGFVEVASGVRDPIAEATEWNRQAPAILLDWLAGWLSDLLRLASGHPAPVLINQDKIADLRNLAETLDPRVGHHYLMQILEARADEHSSLNSLLLYESLLVKWARSFRKSDPPIMQRG
ncbi:MAG: DNA polymerase III subunit delta' [Chromatiaceae bacterium]|nr:DNA polymerase III subunit delta' [Chromatiaceae bacterium]